MVHQRLYINVDHIATIRQARRSTYPDPVEGAVVCERAGADGITAHLREDRRHIQDADVNAIAAAVTTVFNFEMACTPEMLAIAERLQVLGPDGGEEGIERWPRPTRRGGRGGRGDHRRPRRARRQQQ